jgi:hypothetical protein
MDGKDSMKKQAKSVGALPPIVSTMIHRSAKWALKNRKKDFLEQNRQTEPHLALWNILGRKELSIHDFGKI